MVYTSTDRFSAIADSVIHTVFVSNNTANFLSQQTYGKAEEECAIERERGDRKKTPRHPLELLLHYEAIKM